VWIGCKAGGDLRMKTEKLCERIEVIALFQKGKLSPIKFRWKGRTHRIHRIHGDWATQEGITRFHHFAVASDGPDIYELSYNESTYVWQIEGISLIG
jgi:hypothetical protein